MIHELRIYDVVPGRLPNLHRRISEHVLDLLGTHGFRPLAYWTHDIGVSNRLVYVLEFDSLADREEKFAALLSDPAYQSVRERTEADGPIVAQARNYILKPTDYSPLR